MTRRTEVYAALVFAAAWLASLGIVKAGWPAIAVVPCVAVALTAWWVGLRANLRLGRERLRDRPETASRLPRPRVARAIWLSWLLPGLGELYLGLPRGPALRILAAYLATAIPVWTSIVPTVVGIAFALPVWIWGQSHLRRGSGWGWTPLLPTWGEVLARGSTRDTAREPRPIPARYEPSSSPRTNLGLVPSAAAAVPQSGNDAREPGLVFGQSRGSATHSPRRDPPYRLLDQDGQSRASAFA